MIAALPVIASEAKQSSALRDSRGAGAGVEVWRESDPRSPGSIGAAALARRPLETFDALDCFASLAMTGSVAVRGPSI
jgi:hypothetical protein